jgi:hypothetical protein
MVQVKAPAELLGSLGSDSAATTTFVRLEAAFERARTERPESTQESICVFAGRDVRIRIVGRSLAEQIIRPLSHLVAVEPKAAAVQLTIDLWDEREAGVPCVSSGPRDDPGAPLFVAASPDGRFVSYHAPESLTGFDRGRPRMIACFRRSDRLSLHELGRPLDAPLRLWHRDRSVHPVHASLVSREGCGVLFGGPGGSGKSTSALACLLHGFDHLSDDYVGLEAVGDGAFVGYSLFNSTYIARDHLSRFPTLAPHARRTTRPHEDKPLVLLSEVFPTRLARAVPIRVLFLPRVAGGRATLVRPATRGEGLLRLAPTSLMRLPREAGGFEQIARLVQSVSCYWLDLGHALEEIPPRVEEVLQEVLRA